MDNGARCCENARMPFASQIPSSDPALLEKARRLAEEFAQPFMRAEVAGIAFLGALVRGYFDRHADIDIAVFAAGRPGSLSAPQYQRIDGIEVHCHLASIDDEAAANWEMAKRWAYSESSIRYDPRGLLRRLLEQKVPLKPEERRWLMISGITLSEWYINRLTALWVDRGSLPSAHSMFSPGLDHFYEALFGLNGKLVADFKWRLFSAQRLEVLPEDFGARIAEVLQARALDEVELRRRRDSFMAMWRQMLPRVEREVGASYEEFKDTV